MANQSQAAGKLPKGKIAAKTVLAVSISSVLFGAPAYAEQQPVKKLEEVTVIGEKVERSIYETGSSVRVFDEDTIRSTPKLTQVEDLLELTPNLVHAGHGNDLPSVRGIDGSGPSNGGLSVFAGADPRLNLSIDGRSLTYSEIAFGPRSLWDVEQVEVFLGPQSYVQGRNSSAGSIVVKSKDPVHEFETSVKTGYGENRYSQNAAMINVPLVEEQLAVRLSFDQQKRKSAVPIASYEPAGDSKRVETTIARAKFLIEPEKLTGFSSVLAVDHTDTRAPQNENKIGSLNEYRPVYETKSTNGNWFIDWQLNDAFTFENRLIVTEFEFERFSSPIDRGDLVVEGDEFSIEPLIRYQSTDGNLSALFGARYFSSEQDDVYSSNNSDIPMSGETKTASLFAEATYSVAPQFDVTLAARFEKENKKRKAKGTEAPWYVFDLDYDEDVSVFLPKIELAYRPQSNQTIGFRVGKGYSNGGAGLSFDPTDRTGNAPMLAYGFDKEYVWNYELYTRHGLADSRVALTSNWFYNDFDGMQATQARPDNFIVIQNLDDAKTYGAEFGLSWLATYDLELQAAVGLLKTDYTETEAQGGKRKELSRAPSISGNFAALYTFAEGFEASANANYTGSYYSDIANTEAMEVDSYWTVNTQLSYEFTNGRASLFATNLFDDNSITSYFHPRMLDSPLHQTPRMIGASLELNF
ncbi:TonB-dependent receptor [Vibrio sonorensis]|uniref:TonB-dependent receptor n=1 Tax=Vibrio sonorensis TaxID=1004316 RepID=UPI0008D9AB3B|nr:TonB-dependent receptor [Vibrio sonorensis]